LDVQVGTTVYRVKGERGGGRERERYREGVTERQRKLFGCTGCSRQYTELREREGEGERERDTERE
jgi:hypothetical protein